MVRYIIISLIGGVLFGFMDGVINANPMAQKLMAVYKPIAKQTINVPAGITIDLVYGFAMAGIYWLIAKSLPGETGLMKGLSYGLMMWFFRVVMYVASQWMMFKVPINTLCYILVTGLVEMLVLGIFYGLTLKY